MLDVCTVNAEFKSAMKKVNSFSKKVGKAAVSLIKKPKQKTSKLMREKKVKKAVKKYLEIADDIFAENVKDVNVKNFRETVREWSDDWSKLLVYTTKDVENMHDDLVDSEIDEETANKFRKSAKDLIKLFASCSSIYLEIVDRYV